MPDTYGDSDPAKLATFVQEYVRRENQSDAGILAVIAADLRDPAWLPAHVAERLLAKPEIQAAIFAVRKIYKPQEMNEVTADTITNDMERVFQDAHSARQFTAAIAAKKLQAELGGFLVKHVDVNVKHSIGTMSDSDLEAIAKRSVIEGEFTEVGGLPAVVDDRE